MRATLARLKPTASAYTLAGAAAGIAMGADLAGSAAFAENFSGSAFSSSKRTVSGRVFAFDLMTGSTPA